MLKQICIFSFLLVALFPGISFAEAELPLFASEDVVEVTLRADIKGLIESREVRVPNLRPAVLSYLSPSGNTFTQDVVVDVRGNSKRKFCQFPPLLLAFEKRNREPGVFHGIKETKIATHCDPKLTDLGGLSSDGEINVIQEYMIYKLYNLFTNASLKVRLVRIRYEDINGAVEPITRMAFFVEDGGDAARRLGWTREKDIPHSYSDFEPLSFSRTLMFSMMVGHNDWRIQPNGELYNSKAYRDTTGNLHLMLYDFDLTQMMGDGSHAAPIRVMGPGLMHWGPGATASMFNRSEEEFTELKRVTTEIREKFVCLNDEDIVSLMAFVKSFQLLGANVLDNPLLASKQREHSKRIFNEFFELLDQNKLDMGILKSACVL